MYLRKLDNSSTTERSKNSAAFFCRNPEFLVWCGFLWDFQILSLTEIMAAFLKNCLGHVCPGQALYARLGGGGTVMCEGCDISISSSRANECLRCNKDFCSECFCKSGLASRLFFWATCGASQSHTCQKCLEEVERSEVFRGVFLPLLKEGAAFTATRLQGKPSFPGWLKVTEPTD